LLVDIFQIGPLAFCPGWLWAMILLFLPSILDYG
jgi:hypothetical protein